VRVFPTTSARKGDEPKVSLKFSGDLKESLIKSVLFQADIVTTEAEPSSRASFTQVACLHLFNRASSHIRSTLAGKMSALATKQQSLKIFEKLKSKQANKVSGFWM